MGRPTDHLPQCLVHKQEKRVGPDGWVNCNYRNIFQRIFIHFLLLKKMTLMSPPSLVYRFGTMTRQENKVAAMRKKRDQKEGIRAISQLTYSESSIQSARPSSRQRWLLNVRYLVVKSTYFSENQPKANSHLCLFEVIEVLVSWTACHFTFVCLSVCSGMEMNPRQCLRQGLWNSGVSEQMTNGR